MPATPHAINRIRRGLFSKKVGTFLICLLIAALLWLVHALNRNYKHTISVPVKFINLPANKVIIGELPDKLQFDIKTSGLKLAFMLMKDHYNELQIDFNSLKSNAKSQAYSLSTGNLNLNSSLNFDVEVVKIRPDTLFFSLNKGAARVVPVKANVQVSCAPGYQVIHRPLINPAYITVTGDSSTLRLIDTVYTQPITEANLSANCAKKVMLKKPSSSVYFNTGEVNVNLVVDRVTEAEVQVPVKLINAPEGAQIKLLPATATVKYLVAMKDYEAVNKSSFKVVADYKHVAEGRELLPLELFRIPSEASNIRLVPIHVKYLVYK